MSKLFLYLLYIWVVMLRHTIPQFVWTYLILIWVIAIAMAGKHETVAGARWFSFWYNHAKYNKVKGLDKIFTITLWHYTYTYHTFHTVDILWQCPFSFTFHMNCLPCRVCPSIWTPRPLAILLCCSVSRFLGFFQDHVTEFNKAYLGNGQDFCFTLPRSALSLIPKKIVLGSSTFCSAAYIWSLFQLHELFRSIDKYEKYASVSLTNSSDQLHSLGWLSFHWKLFRYELTLMNVL